MIQKNSLYVMTIIIIFSFLTVSYPSSVAAVKSNVTDWFDEKQPSVSLDIEEKKGSSKINTSEDKSFILIIGQLILYTLLIIVLIYGLIKFLALKQKNLQPNQAVTLMGGTPLGNNKSLQLVKVGDHVLLVGVGDQVTLIKEFSGTDEINSIENNSNEQSTLLSNSIISFIKDKLSKRTKTIQKRSFENLFSQSLDKQKGKQDQLKHDLQKEDDERKGRLL